MADKDYPALFRAADIASNVAQANLLCWLKVNNVLLICAAAVSLVNPGNTWMAIVSSILFLGSLLVYVRTQQQDLRSRWYQARALAESVKTATWRLMMSADPFSDVNESADIDRFLKLLSELLQQNKGIAGYLTGNWSQQEQVTPQMVSAMRQTFNEKKSMYLAQRIDEQRNWYAQKSEDNRKASKKYFWFICGVYGIAIFLVLVRVGWPSTRFLPINVVTVIASSLIGWTQMKRFDELASSYGLTAHEVGIIKSQYNAVTTPNELSDFVSDAENAFSREHTQWAARRDH